MTLSLRTRLTVVYTAVFGLLLTAISLVSYEVLARQLDTDATASLMELTSGLHGYLKFDNGIPTVSYDLVDADEAAFVHEATRYYQIFDADSGQLIVQSRSDRTSGTAASRRARFTRVPSVNPSKTSRRISGGSASPVRSSTRRATPTFFKSDRRSTPSTARSIASWPCCSGASRSACWPLSRQAVG